MSVRRFCTRSYVRGTKHTLKNPALDLVRNGARMLDAVRRVRDVSAQDECEAIFLAHVHPTKENVPDTQFLGKHKTTMVALFRRFFLSAQLTN